MKTRLTCMMAFATSLIATTTTFGQANQSLSNLTSPTAVNTDLLPGTNNTRSLGSSGLSWKRLYLNDRVYMKNKIIIQIPGSDNFFVGTSAGNSSVTGSSNTALGSNALALVSSGYSNTATGSFSLYNNTTGFENTVSGSSAMLLNTTGKRNTALGRYALYANTTGSYNIALGYAAGFHANTGYSNIAIGASSLYNSTYDNNLLAIGDSALYTQGTGFSYGCNVAIGSKAMYAVKDGDYTTAVGFEAMKNATLGFESAAFGYRVLYNSVQGYWNTGMGYAALGAVTDGFQNTAVGYAALNLVTTGLGNTAIGFDADVTSATIGNATAIGNLARVDASNKVRIGNSSVTSIGGQVGWSIFSDGRYKKNVKEDVPGLAFINSLRPITYTLDVDGIKTYFKEGVSNTESKRAYQKKSTDETTSVAAKLTYTGFVAQEVEAAAKKMNYEFSGVDKPQSKDGVYGLRYDNFVAPLVKAVQELSAINKQKDEQMAAQEQKIDALQQQLNEIKAMLTTQGMSAGAVSSAMAKTNNATLEQNIPNPFAKTTTISYTMPEHFSAGKIVITDLNGKTLKQFAINNTGKNNVQIDAGDLAAGTYYYSLYIDGKVAATKQMMHVQ